MTNSTPKMQSHKRSSVRFSLPDLPQSQWCDMRRAYIENNLTLSELAKIYKCDARTVKACLIRNKSSGALGKKSTPTRIDPFRDDLQELLTRHLEKLPEDIHSIYQLSRHLLPLLKECGYRGSERTLRNYLHLHPAVRALFEKGQHHA